MSPLGTVTKKSQKTNTKSEPPHLVPPLFTHEHIETAASFFDTLKRIHTRLAVEGYEIEEGRIRVPPHVS